MAYYMFQAKYDAAQVKALVANPQDRSVQARKLVEGLGGKLHQFFFSFGDYDILAIIEGPDNIMMAAGAMAVGAAGTASAVKTTVLLTPEESVAAMKKAVTATGYKPPSG